MASRARAFHKNPAGATAAIGAQVREAGRAGGIPVSVCGEMASEPLGAILLIGLGYDTLSVASPSLPLIKWLVRKVPGSACLEAAAEALRAATAGEVETILRTAVQRYVDKRLLGM